MKKTHSLIGTAALLSAAFLASACGGTDEPAPLPGDGDTSTGGSVGGGTGGASGTGGTPGGTGGTPGGTGGGAPVAGTPLFDGMGTWVAGDANAAGIQGAFFVLEDSMKDSVPVNDGQTHTDLTPDTFDETTPTPCVSGTIASVTGPAGAECDASGMGLVMCDWSSLWGGGLGLNLNETGGDASVKSTFDAVAAGVTGFSFQLSGDTGGAVVRFKAKMEGSDSDFCLAVPVGANSVALADLKHNCYTGGVASETLDLTKLVQLEWQIVPEAGTSFTVANFCVENVGYLQ